jgi:hypothetical protein
LPDTLLFDFPCRRLRKPYAIAELEDALRATQVHSRPAGRQAAKRASPALGTIFIPVAGLTRAYVAYGGCAQHTSSRCLTAMSPIRGLAYVALMETAYAVLVTANGSACCEHFVIAIECTCERTRWIYRVWTSNVAPGRVFAVRHQSEHGPA